MPTESAVPSESQLRDEFEAYLSAARISAAVIRGEIVPEYPDLGQFEAIEAANNLFNQLLRSLHAIGVPAGL